MRRVAVTFGAVALALVSITSCATSTDGTPAAAAATGPATGSSPSVPTVTPPSATYDPNSRYTQPELAAAKQITGMQYKPEPNHNHSVGLVKYDMSPPIGGDHSPVWALCDGAVYDQQIANENAVHMLEHGAVWITYNPDTIAASDLAALKSAVDGVNYLALSPYAGLKTPISLQAWNYQLFVSKASDPRIAQFVQVLKYPSSNTPEPGAACSGDGFVASQSTPGHPYNP